MTGSARKTVLAAWLALGSVLIPGVSPAAQETTLAASGRDPAQFPAYVEQLKRRAREQGISQATLDRAFAQIHFVDRVIKADRNQPEQKITLGDYLRRVMSPAKVRQGAPRARTVPAAPGAMDARERSLSSTGALYHRLVGHGERLRKDSGA